MVDVKEKKKQKKKNNTLDSELQIYIQSSEFGSLEIFSYGLFRVIRAVLQ